MFSIVLPLDLLQGLEAAKVVFEEDHPPTVSTIAMCRKLNYVASLLNSAVVMANPVRQAS